ncbi:MAG: radical SAM family heme chaperone HemW [Verrucomicrobiales bacterium]
MSDNLKSTPALYVHVPFCAHKCEYCAFFSQQPSGDQVQRYVDALTREMEMVAGFQPSTIFFGGGTPSLLNMRQWEQIIKKMHDLKLAPAAEWTVECNPATVSLDKATLLKSGGVNRISMGVQSLDEKLLDRLGRIHSREMVFKSFNILRAAGFDNINIDLMFAIPGQTMEIWKATLEEATAMGSEHLSCYEVIYEEDTPLYDQLKAGQFEVDEDMAAEMHQALIDHAAANGFHQYEIANFARTRSEYRSDVPFYACKHNINYWRGGFYYALGPSASGYEPIDHSALGVRTKNWSNTTMYCEMIEKGQRAIESKEILPPLSRAGEIAAFGLRMNAGWPFEIFNSRTGFQLQEEWKTEMEELAARGLAKVENDRFKLTPEGLRFADLAGESFLR